MKKKLFAWLLAMTMSVGLLSGCGNVSQNAVEENKAEETAQALQEEDAQEQESSDVVIRFAALKGPTSMGLAKLCKDAKEGNTKVTYDFSMKTGADEILPLLLKGELDIALIPANAAANLYQKSQGAIAAIDINTLGVLYMVSGDDQIASVEDLKGRTIYLTGKGTTPDLALQHLLKSTGIELSEVTIEYKSEATEVAAVMAKNPDAIGLLPMPYVIAACAQNENLKIVLDVNKEWEKINNGKGLVTGVTVARKAFLEENPAAVASFLEDHRNSVEYVNGNVEEAAELIVELGVVEKAPVAQKAIPKCNIVSIEGEEMKTLLSEYLQILYTQDKEFIGGALPGEDFYYIP